MSWRLERAPFWHSAIGTLTPMTTDFRLSPKIRRNASCYAESVRPRAAASRDNRRLSLLAAEQNRRVFSRAPHRCQNNGIARVSIELGQPGGRIGVSRRSALELGARITPPASRPMAPTGIVLLPPRFRRGARIGFPMALVTAVTRGPPQHTDAICALATNTSRQRRPACIAREGHPASVGSTRKATLSLGILAVRLPFT